MLQNINALIVYLNAQLITAVVKQQMMVETAVIQTGENVFMIQLMHLA